MTISMFVLWALVGWCGTPWPWWWWREPWRIRIPRPPEPDPRFTGDLIIPKIIGVVGGIVGGVVFTLVFDPGFSSTPKPVPWMPGVAVAATTVGAFVGASLFVDIYGMVAGRGNIKNG